MGYEGVLASVVTLAQTLHSARRPEYCLGSGSVRWEQWASISEGRTTSGGSVAAAALAGLSVIPDSRAWAVLYHSRDFDGRDVAVSGVVVAPPGAAPPVAAARHNWLAAMRCSPPTPAGVGVEGQ
jgi:hypothetical protein